MTVLTSFEPIITKNCKVLIVGSMPGVASLQMHQYYAHPRNAFWPIMTEIYGIELGSTYEERCSSLSAKGAGIWDVLKSCRRQGSLDSNIESASEQANDFESLFSKHRSIRTVIFNGGTAERLYKKHILSSPMVKNQNLSYQRLPSTSPAYASMKFVEKLEQWRSALVIARRG
jgi:TDG/mug DNA glycosylase family protein